MQHVLQQCIAELVLLLSTRGGGGLVLLKRRSTTSFRALICQHQLNHTCTKITLSSKLHCNDGVPQHLSLRC